jgi:glycosyltransferase involved in cell wall biosynthesis
LNIFFDNVSFDSSSGPNSFGKKLRDELIKNDHTVSNVLSDWIQDDPDVQLSFIASQMKRAPLIQRLDGIYFNSEQDFKKLNTPIQATYDVSDAVIFQSEFNKELTEHWFGKKENSYVIHNGTDLKAIAAIESANIPVLDKFSETWCCASSWRPHKRLSENIRYFLEHSDENTCLVVAGENPDLKITHERIFYAGSLDYLSLISLYKRSSNFIHLAWLDHCPNVVIDARAAGCHIVCSSAGGTCEIAGEDSTIVQEDKWDYSPVRLYHPEMLDFSLTKKGSQVSNINIVDVSNQYLEAFSRVL